MKSNIEDSLYSVNHFGFKEPFTYIIKHIGAEVRGHGEKAT